MIVVIIVVIITIFVDGKFKYQGLTKSNFIGQDNFLCYIFDGLQQSTVSIFECYIILFIKNISFQELLQIWQ